MKECKKKNACWYLKNIRILFEKKIKIKWYIME